MRAWIVLIICLASLYPTKGNAQSLALSSPLLQIGAQPTPPKKPPTLLVVFSGGVLYFGSLALTEAGLIRRRGDLLENDPRVIARAIAATAADLCLVGAGVSYVLYRKQQKLTASISTAAGPSASLSISF